jgi:inner membrane protein involved in colicin E2 resistance
VHRRRSTPRAPEWLPTALVFAIAVAGMLRILTEHWREGAALLAGSLLIAGVLRTVLPDDRAGLLAVRSRAIDIVLYLGLGLITLALAVTITRSLGVA